MPFSHVLEYLESIFPIYPYIWSRRMRKWILGLFARVIRVRIDARSAGVCRTLLRSRQRKGVTIAATPYSVL